VPGTISASQEDVAQCILTHPLGSDTAVTAVQTRTALATRHVWEDLAFFRLR